MRRLCWRVSRANAAVGVCISARRARSRSGTGSAASSGSGTATRPSPKAKAEKPWLKDADPTEFTCDQWCERYLAKVEREQKASSLYTARQALKAFRAEFGNRSLGSIGDVEAEDWVNSVPPSSVPGSLRA